jgi:hypothetical protein
MDRLMLSSLAVCSQLYLLVGSVCLHVPAVILVVSIWYVKDYSVINKWCVLLPSWWS